MKRKIVLAAVAAATIVASANLGNVYAGSRGNFCLPLKSASYIIAGSTVGCEDAILELFCKLGIDCDTEIWSNCPIIISPGYCDIEVETTTEAESSTTEVETVTTEIATTEAAGENITEKPNVPETTTSMPETSPQPTTKPEKETTKQPTTKPEQETTVGATLSYAEQVVNLVNKERAKAGLNPLTLDKNIEAAALIRAKETEISFSHTRPNGSSFSTVLRENGISFRGAGENIAWGQRSPEEVMNGWMNSSGHRANILNANFTKIGVGYYKSASGRNYWTQLFTY